jgi:diketogulonate reductase-like aldo/keto reductase
MPFVEANGAHIPQLGLGTWELRDARCACIVEQALRLGYRHIDTAEMYDNEREVGEGLRASRIPRDELFVTTKVWWTHFDAAGFRRAAQESLRKLKLDHVDLLLLHWPNASVPLAETMGALNEAKERGVARHIGVANFTVDLIEEAVELSAAPLAVNQVEMHPYLDQSKVAAACRRHGLAVTAYSPIARGDAAKDRTLAAIGAFHKKTPAQVSLRYLVQQEIVVIPRTGKIERLSENAGIFDFELSAEEMKAIHALAGPDGRRVSPSWSPDWD